MSLPQVLFKNKFIKREDNYIKKGTEVLKAARNKDHENKMKNVAKLSKELKNKKDRTTKIDNLVRSTQNLKEEFGYTIKNKRNRLDSNNKSSQKDVCYP